MYDSAVICCIVSVSKFIVAGYNMLLGGFASE